MQIEPETTSVAHLSAGGVSLVVSFAGGAAGEIVYWGPELGAASAAALRGLARSADAPFDGNAPEEPLRASWVPLSSSGWMGRPGLVGHRPDGSAWAPALVLRGARIDGDGITRSEDAVTAGASTLSLDLADDEAGLFVRVRAELVPEGFLRARAEVRNDRESPYLLDELAIALPVPLSADEILDFSGRWGREREPLRLPVELGCHLHEGRHGRTGFDAPMMMFAGRAGFGFAEGTVWGAHVAFSGNHRTWVERLNNGRQVIGAGELLLPGEIVLAQGQSHVSPWTYFACGEGLDAVARRIHRWLRRQPGHPDTARPITLNVWEAVYFDHDLDKLRRLADVAAEVGVERYVLDDGWFRGRRDDRAGLGDWLVDDRVWPGGLHPLVDHVRAHGMQFGLWVEPEMINVDSDLARAHPEWILASGDRLPVEWRHQQVLNLANPDAYAHIRQRLLDLLDEYEIAYLKWDHNRDLIDAGDRRSHGRAVVHEQTLATYRLMDELRERHPGLEIESCSSGGGRIDLEMARHASRFWLSDCIDPHERQGITRWTGQLVPPEMMGTHIASAHSHTTDRVSSLSFRAGTALWGHLGMEWDITDLTPGEREQLCEWFSFYTQNRDFLLSSDIVRADRVEPSLWLQGVVSPDRSRALYQLVARRRSPLSPRGRLGLPGLDEHKTYRVRPLLVGGGPEGLFAPGWFGADGEGTVLTGRMLAHDVLHAPLISPDQVLLIEAQEVSGPHGE
ncbi:alpha-galactosidase [Microbacterium sp. 18062]|uniref:alpha-galactosidase n=1 Tax=Microbacterium sp. 18062 TaxID=2681410 RepID=UPI00135A925D|nr:alpha-galactosidase [Microbacterium sp. 18062]